MSRARQMQAWQLLFRKLSQETSYVNENFSVGRDDPRICLFAQKKLGCLLDLKRLKTN
jgi:hypothetical protein